jgi:tetratricopeptide (TPR) repeat protein
MRDLNERQISGREKGREVLQGNIAILEALASGTQPSDPELAFTLAAAHRLMGEIQVKREERGPAAKSFAEARSRLKTVAASAAANAELMRSVIRAQRALAGLLEPGDAEAAVALYRDAIDTAKALDARATPDSEDRGFVGETYSEISLALEEMQRYDAAAEVSEEWTRARPTEALAWNALCWHRAILGTPQQALTDCDEALRLDPKNSSIWDSRGFAYLKLGEFDKAIADYDRALMLNERQAFSQYSRGVAKRRKGDDMAGAEEDIAAAKAQNSKVENDFEKLMGK